VFKPGARLLFALFDQRDVQVGTSSFSSLRGAIATKQSSFLFLARKAGLLCFARNDGGETSLALRSVIGAAFVAAVTMHADAGDLTGVLHPLPDKAREIFQCRKAQRLDLVEQLVIELLAHL